MSWSRVKTILIVLFICIDAFLLSNIIISKGKSSAVPQDIVQSTVTLLKQNNITIDADIIPRRITKTSYIQADNVITDYEDFTKLFVPNAGTNDQLHQHTDIVRFYQGDQFVCSPDITSKMDAGDERAALNTVKTYLKERGFDLSQAKFSSVKNDTGYTITIKNYCDEFPLFNSIVTVNIENSTIARIEGSWFNITDVENQESTLKNAAGILIDFMASHQDNSPIVITELEMGYSVFESDTYHKSAMLIPCWKITTADNQAFYLDARNAE